MTIFSSIRTVSRRAVLMTGLVVAMSAVVPPAAAQSVDEIKKSGVLRAGVQVAQVPWGFTDAQGKLTGYDVEFVRLLANDLGVEPNFVPVTAANRVAALLTGQVDMLAAVMGIFPDRQKVVLFSRPYTTNENVIIAAAGPAFDGLQDLKGMRIGVPRGTPMDLVLTKDNPGVKLQRFDDDATTAQALISGQVDAIGAAVTQAGNIDKAVGAGKYQPRLVMQRAFNGVAVRPTEREWVEYLNDFIGRKIASGELPALYQTWLGGELAAMPDTGEGDAPLPVMMPK